MLTEDWASLLEGTVPEVLSRIAAAAQRAGRDPDAVRLIAVTKTHPVVAVEAAVRAGVRDLGENRAADLATKATAVPATWHFLGKLQSGTVRHVADHADVVHSAEPGGAVQRLARRRAASHRLIEALIEVDFTGRRQGVGEDEALDFADALAATEGLRLAGLMTIPPQTPEAARARPYFAKLRELSERLRDHHPGAAELSMGMSLDYEIGVEEGATMVRVGTALFGPRPARG